MLGGLECGSPQGREELDKTERLNNNTENQILQAKPWRSQIHFFFNIMPSIYNLASPLYPQGNLLPFAHDSVTRLWKANLQTILTSMSRAGDGVILMTEVSSLLPDSAYVQEIKPSGLRKLAFQGSKDRKKPVLIFPTTFSPRSRSLPRFSARGNLFRTIHSERLI